MTNEVGQGWGDFPIHKPHLNFTGVSMTWAFEKLYWHDPDLSLRTGNLGEDKIANIETVDQQIAIKAMHALYDYKPNDSERDFLFYVETDTDTMTDTLKRSLVASNELLEIHHLRGPWLSSTFAVFDDTRDRDRMVLWVEKGQLLRGWISSQDRIVGDLVIDKKWKGSQLASDGEYLYWTEPSLLRRCDFDNDGRIGDYETLHTDWTSNQIAARKFWNNIDQNKFERHFAWVE